MICRISSLIDTRFSYKRIEYDYEKIKCIFSKRNKIKNAHLIDTDNSYYEFWKKSL